jgi:hypothetical protein
MDIFHDRVGYFIDKYWEMKNNVDEHGTDGLADKKLFF